MQLSTHFTLDEMIASDTATRLNINNQPALPIISRLRVVASLMELVRINLGSKPINISSGFRCDELNTRIGGAENSAHCQGYAVDFTCPAFGSPDKIFLALKNDADLLEYDQLILEGTWIHLSFAPTKRKQNLIADFTKNQPTHYNIG